MRRGYGYKPQYTKLGGERNGGWVKILTNREKLPGKEGEIRDKFRFDKCGVGLTLSGVFVL